LRGLAVTSPKRSSAAPDLPTMAEAGYPEFKAVVWRGFSAPTGTPRAVVDRLNASAREALQAPEVVTRFQELGAERVGSSPDEVAQLVAREIDVWSDVVRRSGVKAN
jgi:tripartite-type tricarboxylate transporter receptor subunit TctC